MTNGWTHSASAWITNVSDGGDYGRKYVLDAPMLARIRDRGFRKALDVGCGEGRFCRMMTALGIRTIGIDPTEALIGHAKLLDPNGDYRLGEAESLDFPDQSFDLVVSYLSLIDIADFKNALREMVRVLTPQGALLIANLNGFITAGDPEGWVRDAEGTLRFYIDNYLDERAQWVGWRGIKIENWHRPLSSYMSLLIEQGLELRHFSEPAPVGGDPDKAARYRRAPYFVMMEWQKV